MWTESQISYIDPTYSCSWSKALNLSQNNLQRTVIAVVTPTKATKGKAKTSRDLKGTARHPWPTTELMCNKQTAPHGYKHRCIKSLPNPVHVLKHLLKLSLPAVEMHLHHWASIFVRWSFSWTKKDQIPIDLHAGINIYSLVQKEKKKDPKWFRSLLLNFISMATRERWIPLYHIR